MKERIKKIEPTEDSTKFLWEVDGKICKRVSLDSYIESYSFPQEGEYLLPEDIFPETAYKIFHKLESLIDPIKKLEHVPELYADERSGPGLSDLLKELVLLRDCEQGVERKFEIKSHYSKRK